MGQTQQGEFSMKVIQGGNQMSLLRESEEIIKFLEFTGRKAILNEHAVNNRLTACHNLFSVINEEEDNIDYILGNLEVLINRFRNRNNNVRASTLKVYKSRVKSSLEDYKAWCANPFQWERSVSDKQKAFQALESKKVKKEKVKVEVQEKVGVEVAEAIQQAGEAPKAVHNSLNERRVAFPIRAGFTIEMTLPADGLSLKELKRLGLFLYPYCNDYDHEKSPWALLN